MNKQAILDELKTDASALLVLRRNTFWIYEAFSKREPSTGQVIILREKFEALSSIQEMLDNLSHSPTYYI